MSSNMNLLECLKSFVEIITINYLIKKYLKKDKLNINDESIRSLSSPPSSRQYQFKSSSVIFECTFSRCPSSLCGPVWIQFLTIRFIPKWRSDCTSIRVLHSVLRFLHLPSVNLAHSQLNSDYNDMTVAL